MNQANKDAINSTLEFVPREPSCRKPLKRIMNKSASKSPIMRHSKSRERSVETDDEQENAEMTSDENEEENSSPSDISSKEKSFGSSYKKLYPELPDINDHTPNSPKSTSHSSSITTTSKTVHRKKVISTHSGIDDRTKRETSNRRSTKKSEKSSSNENIFKYFLYLFILLGIFFCYYVWSNTNSSPAVQIEESTLQNRFQNFLTDLRGIRNKFPHQNRHTWSDISAGIQDVMNTSAKTWIFILFSNESIQITCLADLLGTASSKALLSENRLILNPKDFGSEYGDAIDRWKPLIMEKKAVVVHDVLSIDPGAIQAFHTMCDRYNPLVEGAVYILTIIAPGYNPSEKPEVFVENQLIDTFINKVPEDKLQPLVTRLTDGPIIQVLPEKGLTSCSL